MQSSFTGGIKTWMKVNSLQERLAVTEGRDVRASRLTRKKPTTPECLSFTKIKISTCLTCDEEHLPPPAHLVLAHHLHPRLILRGSAWSPAFLLHSMDPDLCWLAIHQGMVGGAHYSQGQTSLQQYKVRI